MVGAAPESDTAATPPPDAKPAATEAEPVAAAVAAPAAPAAPTAPAGVWRAGSSGLAIACGLVACIAWAASSPATGEVAAARAQAWRLRDLETRVHALEHELREIRGSLAATDGAAGAPPSDAAPDAPPAPRAAATGATDVGRANQRQHGRQKKKMHRRRLTWVQEFAARKQSEDATPAAATAPPPPLAQPRMAAEWVDAADAPKMRRVGKSWRQKLADADDDGASLLEKWERRLAHAQKEGHTEKARTILMKIKSAKRKLTRVPGV